MMFEKSSKLCSHWKSETPQREEVESALESEIMLSEKQRLTETWELLSNQAWKMIFSYFNKWKKSVEFKKECIRTNILMKLIRSYHYDSRIKFFNRWRNSIQSIKKNEIKAVINHNECQNAYLIKSWKSSVTSLNTHLIDSKSRATIKIFKISLAQDNKYARGYFSRWKDAQKQSFWTTNILNSLFTSFQKRILKNSFDQYINIVKFTRRQEVIEVRCKYLQNAIKAKQMSSIFNAFKQSTFSSKLLKSSLSRILNQMKTDNLRISFNIWTKVNWNAEEHNK